MTRNAGFAIGLAVLVACYGHAADARGGRGSGHGFSGGMRGTGAERFSGGRRYGNETYAKADERDRLLNTKIKSICRGC